MGGTETEQFEVLDEQGHKTGQLLDRGTIHEQQLWHEAVNVIVLNSTGDMLVQLRGKGVDIAPDVWDVAIGTHLRPQEDPVVAAQRCLQGELGLTITPEQLQHLFNIQSANQQKDGKMHKVLGHVFLLKRDIDLHDFAFDANRVAKLAWKPLLEVMAEVGSTESAAQYFPRGGNYYPLLLEALQAEM
jgi:isopentenyldiphosphate isomerase